MVNFTEEQEDLLNELEEAFPVDPYLHNVTGRDFVDTEYGYLHWINRNLEDALRHWAQYKYAINTDWEAENRKRALALSEEAKAKKIIKRENHVSGILSGLIPKAIKAGSVEFETTDWSITLTVWKDLQRVLTLSWDRDTYELESYLVGKDWMDNEDWSDLDGSEPPRNQSVALDAIMTYLEGL